MKILLVEDEKELSAVLAKGLQKLAYAVDTAGDGEEALSMLEINEYDLVVLDLNLPKIQGMEVLRRIRGDRDVRSPDCKVLILSARNQVQDKIEGLDLGANDYLEKPFDFGELSARIRNLLRWVHGQQPSILMLGTLSLDTAARCASVKGTKVGLTNKEYGILEYLASNRGRVVSAEELIEHVWDSQADPFSNSFKFHIFSLKKKLGIDGLIQNIRGQGYILREEL